MSNTRYRSICFTINNYTFDDIIDILDASEYKYLILAFEEGKKGTPHIQGFCTFRQQLYLPYIRRFMPRAHIEPMKGTHKQASDYCKKDGEYFEFGDIPTPGKVTWDRIQTAMENPTEDPHTYHIYRKTYREIQLAEEAKREKDKRLYCLEESQVMPYLKASDEKDDICCYPSEYDGERIHIIDAYAVSEKKVKLWVNNIPYKYKYGFETPKYDPEIIILTYEGAIAENYIKKTYKDDLDLF